MKFKKTKPTVLTCTDQEVITFKVRAQTTAHLVTFTKDTGEAGIVHEADSLTFLLDKAGLDKENHNPTILTFLFTFSSANDGVYEVEASGSAGGDPSIKSVKQLFGKKFDSIFYTITVL